MRLRPPRRWNRMGMRATRVCPSNRMPLEIGVHRHTIAPAQLARPCSPSPPRALRKVERLGEEQRVVETAANFSRGAWC
jgi:hypothetical protein